MVSEQKCGRVSTIMDGCGNDIAFLRITCHRITTITRFWESQVSWQFVAANVNPSVLNVVESRNRTSVNVNTVCAHGAAVVHALLLSRDPNFGFFGNHRGSSTCLSQTLA